jgi:uncharacterized protein (DUF2132 family)
MVSQEANARMTRNSKPQEQPNNPLHGMSLEKILLALVDFFGWEGLFDRINLRCFFNEPSIKSSLKYLRRTGWAREEVEKLYLEMLEIQKGRED